MSGWERQKAGDAPVQRRAVGDDWGPGRNGVAVSTQLRQNAAFKARMLAGRPAVQRKEYRKRGEADPNAHLKRTLRVTQIDDPATVCAILQFVWPERNITAAACSSPGHQALAVLVVNEIVRSSDFLAVTPRPAVPTPGWVLEQVKGAVVRYTGDTDIYGLALRRLRSALGAEIRTLGAERASGAFTEQRGLGY